MSSVPERSLAVASIVPRRDMRPIWQVADGRYGMDRTRPNGETWQLARTPWWRGPLDDFRREDVREVVIMAGSQCSKSAGMLMALAWACAHSPAPMLWITGNDDLAKDASQERVTPTLERCPDTAPLLLNNRLDKTTWKIRLKTCTVDIAGAQSSTSLEQNPYRFVFGDEVRQWPPGALQKVEKRQRSFSDAKRCFFSTPNLKGDEFHQRYLSGTQNQWVWPCMGCGNASPLNWAALKYGEDRPAGPVLVCPSCGHQHPDRPDVRRHIIDRGAWQQRNQTPQPGVASYHWNAILPPWVKWSDLVHEWNEANYQRNKKGNREPLKIFICESLGEPWEEQEDKIDQSAIDGRAGDYRASDPWDGELVRADTTRARFIGADVQQDCIYWRCRMFGPEGASRGHGWGRVFTFAELDEVRQKLGVSPKLVMVDSGYNAPEVYAACMKYGWKPSKGHDREHFTQEINGQNVRTSWMKSIVDPHSGTTAAGRTSLYLFSYADRSIQDMLHLYIMGKVGNWTYESDAGPDYIAQLASEEKYADPRTGEVRWRQVRKANHLRDCEKEILLAALASGILRA